jgi:HTH-type transcriptional regulator / antitoxin HigA
MATEMRGGADFAIAPGELLAETLNSLGLKQAELARRTGRPVQAINEIVKGVKEITPETALQFERVLGVPAHIWTRLEADYRQDLARLHDRKRLEEQEVPLARRFPYREMAALGWVPDVKDWLDRAIALLQFFRVSSLEHIQQRELEAAWRRSASVSASQHALRAWLMSGERDAEGVRVASFSRDVLAETIPELRGLTRESPSIFCPRMTKLLAGCGVAVVFVRHLPRTGVQGATQWVDRKAVVQLSIRYKWADIFWFSLFHELGHLLLHQHKGVFVNPSSGEKSDREREADVFAGDALIPQAKYKRFIAIHSVFLADHVEGFAREVGIHPSIVVGRLQHDGLLPHSHLNDLRPRFDIVEHNA